MTADERAAALVRWWVRLYTRHLPSAVARDRQAELTSDLWEECAAARAAGKSPAATTRSVLSRALAGVPADIAWRSVQQLRVVTRDLQSVTRDAPATMIRETAWQHVRLLVCTRRCHACGRRYERRYPYCAVCKTSPTQEIVDRRAP